VISLETEDVFLNTLQLFAGDLCHACRVHEEEENEEAPETGYAMLQVKTATKR